MTYDWRVRTRTLPGAVLTPETLRTANDRLAKSLARMQRREKEARAKCKNEGHEATQAMLDRAHFAAALRCAVDGHDYQDIPGMGVVCRCCGEKEHKGKL